jgi:hypothetical protein
MSLWLSDTSPLPGQQVQQLFHAVGWLALQTSQRQLGRVAVCLGRGLVRTGTGISNSQPGNAVCMRR